MHDDTLHEKLNELKSTLKSNEDSRGITGKYTHTQSILESLPDLQKATVEHSKESVELQRLTGNR